MKKTYCLQMRVVIVSLMTILLAALLAPYSTQAASFTLTTDDGISNILKLEAKIKYLTAWIDALKDGKQTPGPTMTVFNSGRITLLGTLARNPDDARIEVCGPMEKGTVDWADGVTESIMGLGCSGNVHEFVMQHDYEESGSYKIVVTDAVGRTLEHVVAVHFQDN